MKFAVLSVMVIVLFLLNLFVGSVDIPARDVIDILLGDDTHGAAGFIVTGSRLPMAVTALLAGAGLARVGADASDLFPQSACRTLDTRYYLGCESRSGAGIALFRRVGRNRHSHDWRLCRSNIGGVCGEYADDGGATRPLHAIAK